MNSVDKFVIGKFVAVLNQTIFYCYSNINIRQAAATQLTQLLVNIQNNGILPTVGKRDLINISDAEIDLLVDQLLNLISQTVEFVN
jgi:hypothetical protein